jgi:outer membrane protein assembly factor BamE (lipoprotein component of BamABCDE complex)
MPSKSALICFLLLFALLFQGCRKTVTYVVPDDPVRAMLNKGTQDDVTKQLGPPTATRALSDGGEVWSYDKSSASTSSTQDGTSTNTMCRRVVLIFDRDKILRDFHRENC